MRDFKDAKGRPWTIHVTLGVARKIKARFSIDLLEPESDANQLTAFALSLNSRLELLWMLVADEASRLEVSRDEFEDAMSGSHIKRACLAVDEELSFFIHEFDPTLSQAFGNLLSRSRDLQMQSMERLEAFLDSDEVKATIQTELDKALDEATRSLLETAGKPSGRRQASSR